MNRSSATPDFWDRFESLDHSANDPTVVLAWAADTDENVVTFEEYSRPGLVSTHAAVAQALSDVDLLGRPVGIRAAQAASMVVFAARAA